MERMGMAEEITGAQINDVLHFVKGITSNGDMQLTLLARALVVACHSCEITKEVAMPIIEGVFDEPINLKPLYQS